MCKKVFYCKINQRNNRLQCAAKSQEMRSSMSITVSRFWDLGEEDIINPSQKSLYKIMNALILCKGKMHDSYSGEIKEHEWTSPTRSCAVVLRISLPIGEESKFEELSGFKLSKVEKAGVL